MTSNGSELDSIFRDPERYLAGLRGAQTFYGLRWIRLGGSDNTMVVIHLELAPWAPMAREGYPDERLVILVLRDGRVLAVPHTGAERRTWRHRMPGGLRELCLWYRDDQPSLRWSWEEGLSAFITVAHRHLMAEEYFRRNQLWPFEEAPHGMGPHPVASAGLRAATGTHPQFLRAGGSYWAQG